MGNPVHSICLATVEVHPLVLMPSTCWMFCQCPYTQEKQQCTCWLTSCSPSPQSACLTITGPRRHQDQRRKAYLVVNKSCHCWLGAGLKVLIYSGDHDMCVPHTGSEAWTSSLGLKVKEAWRPWKVDHQVPTPGYSLLHHVQSITTTIKAQA